MTFRCTHCGIDFNRKKTKSIEPTNPFCSRNCFTEYRTKWRCQICNSPVSSKRSYCAKHVPRRPRTITSYQSVKKRRQNIKAKAVEYLGGSCARCGYNRCLRSLDFHHTDPSQKDFTISNNSGKSWSDIKIELNKCILVCSNCHGEIHDEMVGDKRIELLSPGNQPGVLPLN
jgi:hypothetical protein